MKHKFSLMGRVAIALVLALSLSLVMAAPVAAAHTVSATSDVAGSTPGASKTITVTVGNTGAAEAIDVVVIDIPPPGDLGSTWNVTEFAAGIPTGWEVAVATDKYGDRIDTLTYTGLTDTIPIGESDDFTFTATAPAWAGDYIFTVNTTDTVMGTATGTFTIVVDGTSPVLNTIAWGDEGSTDIGVDDTLVFTFSEDMDPLTVTTANIDANLPITGTGTTYDAASVVWNVSDTVATVTLGASVDIASGDTVNPTDDVTDVAGNPDATVPTGVPLALPTIEDDVGPTLNTIVWADGDNSTGINAGDTLVFTFSEAMDTTTVAVGTLSSRLPLSAGSYGDGATIAWATDGKSLTVTLGTNVNILDLATVDPDPLVTDAAGNADDTAAGGPAIDEDVGPILRSITWNDLDSSASINPGDTLTFVFSEKMNTTTIDNNNIGARLATSEGHSYGTLTAGNLSWNDPDNYILAVTLGTGTTIQPNETVNPDVAVTDVAGNGDATDGDGPPIAQVTVSVDAPATVVQGQSFVATLNITDVTGLDAASYNVMFDSAILELTSVTAGTVGTTAIPVGATTNILDVDLVVGVRVVQNVSGTAGVSGSGTLAVLNFTFIGNSGENSTITLDITMLSDKDANEIYANWFGDLVAATALVGDANGDGSLNALDITKIELIVAGDPDHPETPGADANEDGNIDALDITKVELLVGGFL